MKFNKQKKMLLLGTIITFVFTLFIFTFLIHRNSEESRLAIIESKLKGDAKSILPHLYQSGNNAWFKANLEQFKTFGLTCLNVEDISGKIIWGDQAKCQKTIDAKNYIEQSVFKINYSLPPITFISTLKKDGHYFSIFFFIQTLFFLIAYILLSKINKKYYLKKIENESQNRTLELTRTLGHNLKSPMAALNTMYEIASEKLNQEEREIFNSIKTNFNRVCDQIILQEEIKPSLHLVDISIIIKDVILMKQIEYPSIVLENEISPNLYSLIEKTEFSHVLSNLVNNSIEAKSSIRELKIKLTAKSDNKCTQIIIEDNGVGISKEKVPTLFKYGNSLKKGNFGCGLHHALNTIKSFNGAIDIESIENMGTKVIIKLPCFSNNKFNKIILIDDESLNILSWKGMAKKHGIDFEWGNNFQDFLKLNIEPSDKNIIYVDYNLRDVNGLTVATNIRACGHSNIFIATGDMKISTGNFPKQGKEFPIFKTHP